MIRAIFFIMLCLPVSAVAAEWITVTVLSDTEAAQIVTQQAAATSEVNLEAPGTQADIGPWGIRLDQPDLTTYGNVLEDMQKLVMQAGSDFRFPMQYRLGSDPYPFEGGYWPTAELRSAKSPAGVVLATYTITVDDEAQVKWSLRLTAAQTAALSGMKGFTEIKFPYPVGVYHMFVRIPTEILPRVTL
jgi:hypothetical protein